MIGRPILPTVLVIDDERGPRESLRILLKGQYDVVTAESVAEGLKRLRESRPAAIILDIRMPERNGIDGLREIRMIDPHVSVIMLTGYAQLESAQDALRLGANDYLKKPFDTKEMCRVVAANVQRATLARAAAEAAQVLGQANARLASELAETRHMATLGQASAELTHDLRNPLSIIQAYVNLLGKQLEESPDKAGVHMGEVVEFVGIIEKNVRRCSDLVHLWQNLCVKDPKRIGVVRIPDLLRDVAKACSAMLGGAGRRITVEPAAESCEIVADGVQIHRAVQNVVQNAVQSLQGADGHVALTCRRSGSCVEIEVRDNGCGIPPEAAKRLFEPYFTTKPSGQGTGLGLFIAKKVIEDHQGTVAVVSGAARGTTVTIRLPCRPSSPPARPAPARATVPAQCPVPVGG